MLTDREQSVVRWLRRRKVATMQQIRQQFDISHMTVVRALQKHGYHTSVSHNARYYTPYEIPQFDAWGLWTYRHIHFSKHGTIKNTLAVLVEQAPAGRTTAELATRVHGDVPHVLSRLVKDGRLTRRRLPGRSVVYLAADARRAERQFQQRQRELAAPQPLGLPGGWAADDVVAVLRQMILRPRQTPQRWAEQLRECHVNVTADQIRQVMRHYALEKKRPS
jgi:hypothetical protein